MTGFGSPGNSVRLLTEHQRLATSGARAVLPFNCGGRLRLAIPQLAMDIPGTPAHMNGGDSNIDMLLYRWAGGRFIEDGRLSVPGGEDAFAFQIDNTDYLATASIRTGAGPYDLNTDSTLYRRSGRAGRPFRDFRPSRRSNGIISKSAIGNFSRWHRA